MTPPTPLSDDRKRSLLALRVVLALAAGAVALGRPSAAHPAFLPILGLYLATDLLLLFLRPSALFRPRRIMFLFSFDLAVVTALMLLGGETRSQFYVAFFLVILMAGLTRSAKTAWATAGISALVYGLAVGASRPEQILEIGFTTRLAFFFAAAVFAGFLAEETQQEDREARRLAEEVLHEREVQQHLKNLYRLLFDESADGILLAGPDGTVRVANRRARDLLGRDPIGLTYGRIFGMSDTQIVPALKGLPSPKGPSIMNLDLKRPDGRTLSCEVVHKSVDLEGQPHALFLLRDVGPVRDLHRRMRELEKMSVLGRLLGSMAHEINNPLSVILGYAELIQSGAVPPENLREYVGHIREAGERCRLVLTGFLNQYRSRPFTPQDVPLGPLVRRTLELMEFHLRYHLVRSEADLDDAVSVRGDPRQIEEVLINLLINAVQAMKDQPRRILTVRLSREGGEAVLTIADTGCGIPPERQKNLFDRGVTGKDEGHGLGLSLCREIVSRHGGRIEFASRPGHTVFTVRFPSPAA